MMRTRCLLSGLRNGSRAHVTGAHGRRRDTLHEQGDAQQNCKKESGNAHVPSVDGLTPGKVPWEVCYSAFH